VSTAGSDELIHAPTRLEIVSLLAAAQWADFKYIRDELGLSDSALSKQLSTLESASYIEILPDQPGPAPISFESADPLPAILRLMQHGPVHRTGYFAVAHRPGGRYGQGFILGRSAARETTAQPRGIGGLGPRS
jgi:DNA-binding transcriptional ArsR family regulator